MKRWELISGILLAVLGLLVIIFPGFWIKVIYVLLGVCAIVYGIYNFKLAKTLANHAENDSSCNKTLVIRGSVGIVIGLCAILFPFIFQKLGNVIWGIIVWIIIIYLIVSAALGFYAAALLRNTGIDRKKYIFENVSLVLIAVVLILISPKGLGDVIIRIIGVITMLIGVAFIVLGAIVRSKVNDEIHVAYEVKDDVSANHEAPVIESVSEEKEVKDDGEAKSDDAETEKPGNDSN